MVASAKKASRVLPPSAGDWEESVGEIIYGLYAVDRYSLVVVIGPDDETRRALAAEMAARRPERAIFREFRLEPGSLNAFEDYSKAREWRDDYVTLVYGLEALSTKDRRKALRLMNWNRGMLERGNLRVVLWVPHCLEEDVVEHAGDLLDWWTVYIELPSAPKLQSWRDASSKLESMLGEAVQLRDEEQRADAAHSRSDAEIVRLKRERRMAGALRVGDIIGNRYRLIERIGSGGFATVWRAKDMSDGSDIALKILHSQHVHDRTMIERFFRGARRMADLDHPSIARVLVPEGRDGDCRYFTMELHSRGDLGRAVSSASLTQVDLLERLAEAGDGLAFAHQRGLVHRDVKPSNILLGEDGHARLTDFDLVGAPDTTGGTRTGALGSMMFSPPEAMANARAADASSDVYSLGMTAVWALRGGHHDLFRVLRDPNGLVDELRVHDELKAVLKASIAFDAGDRPPLMELVAALRAATHSEPR